MLSDEEKQAIEYLKRHIIPCHGRKGTIEFMLNDIVLNLIEKQSKEIEELKEEKDIYYYEWKHLEANMINKIKAKIEECEKDIEIYNNYEENWHKIEALQSLLEKE